MFLWDSGKLTSKYLNVKKIDGDIFVFRNKDEKKRFFKFSFGKKTENEGNKLEEIEEAEEINEKQE